jgi:RHS repeat-associated protein
MTKLQGDRDSVFGYTGHLWHGESALNLALLRAYDPNLGIWITRDPIGEDGGNNIYSYVLNSPLNLIDELCDVAVTGGGGIYIPSLFTVGIPVGGQVSITVDSCRNVWATVAAGVGTPGPTWGGSIGPDPSPGWGYSGSIGGKQAGVSGPAPGGGGGSPGGSLNGTYTFLLSHGNGCNKPNGKCPDSGPNTPQPGDSGLPLMPVLGSLGPPR